MDFNRTVTRRHTVKRSIRIIERPTLDSDGWFAIEIEQDKRTTVYLARRIPADFGSGAYHLEKLDADLATIDVYDVCLMDHESLCSCRGFLQHGHCKHVAGLLSLERAGLLGGPA
jgi:hypothetical protein